MIKGKVAIVTGASSGIGRATAKLLTEKGAKVALVARSVHKLEILTKELPDSLVIPTDMTKEEEIERMVRIVSNHFNTIDIFVNNAGQGYDAPIEKINIKTLRKIIDLDLIGSLIAMQRVIPIMKQNGGGTIINVSSGTALMFLPGMAAYSSVKRELVGISLTAREELRGDNISVSVVYHYITDTDFEKNTIKEIAESEDQEIERLSPSADSPEYVAQKILEAITSSEAETFAHDWMKN